MNQFQPFYTNASMPFQNYGLGSQMTPYAPMMNSYQAPMMQAMTGMGMMGAMNNMQTMGQTANNLSKISSVFRGFNYSTFLDGTQKTLTTINQIIPLVNQVTPMIRNASTMFRVANEVKRMSQEQPMSASEPIIIEQAATSAPPRSSNDQPTYF